jgi:hypothetical protein
MHADNSADVDNDCADIQAGGDHRTNGCIHRLINPTHESYGMRRDLPTKGNVSTSKASSASI